MYLCITRVVWAIILCLTITVSCTSPDPWDTKHANNPVSPEPWGNQKSKEGVVCVKKCESDYFFRRLLKLLIIEQEQDTDGGVIDAGVSFQFLRSDYNLIKEYLMSSEQLTPVQYRRLDGLLTDSLSRESYIQKNLLFYLKNYYLHAICILSALVCMYRIYTADWSLILTPTPRKMFAIFLITLYAYETMVVYKEVENKYENEFIDSLKPCSFMFWEYKCTPLAPTISHYWTHLHPLVIIGNLSSKLIFGHLLGFTNYLSDASSRLADRCPYGSKFLCSIVLDVFLLIVGLFLAITLGCALIFNRPVSLKFLFFGLSLEQKQTQSTYGNATDFRYRNHAISSRPIVSEDGNLLSGENLTNFLRLAAEKVTTSAQNGRAKDCADGRLAFPKINFKKKKHVQKRKTILDGAGSSKLD